MTELTNLYNKRQPGDSYETIRNKISNIKRKEGARLLHCMWKDSYDRSIVPIRRCGSDSEIL